MPFLLGLQCRRKTVYYGSERVAAAKRSELVNTAVIGRRRRKWIFLNLINMLDE